MLSIAIGLCVLIAFLPLTAILASPVIIFILVFLFFKYHWGFSIGGFIAAALLPLSYLGDLFAVIASIFIILTAGGIILGLKQKKYLLGWFMAIFVGLIALLFPTAIIFGVNDGFNMSTPNDEHFIARYIEDNANRADIRAVGSIHYNLVIDLDDEEEAERLENTYGDAETSYIARQEFTVSLLTDTSIFLFYLMGFASLISSLGFFTVFMSVCGFKKRLNAPIKKEEEKTTDENNETKEETTIENLEPVEFDQTAKNYQKIFTSDGYLDNITLGRKYLLVVFLPVLLLNLIAFIVTRSTVTDLSFLSSALMQSLVTVPGFVAANSLFLYFILKIKRNSLKIILLAAICLLFLISIVMWMVMLFVSLIGIADAILDIRKIIRKVLE